MVSQGWSWRLFLIDGAGDLGWNELMGKDMCLFWLPTAQLLISPQLSSSFPTKGLS